MISHDVIFPSCYFSSWMLIVYARVLEGKLVSTPRESHAYKATWFRCPKDYDDKNRDEIWNAYLFMKVFFSKTRQIRNRRTREKGFLKLEACKNEVDCNIIWHQRKKEQKRKGNDKEKERNLGSKVMC